LPAVVVVENTLEVEETLVVAVVLVDSGRMFLAQPLERTQLLKLLCKHLL
jgi:hypothetical protein